MLAGILGGLLAAAGAGGAGTPATPAAPPAPAVPPRPCAAPGFRQFDFWIGDWEVRTPDGRLAGTNKIEAILEGCALQERWTGSGGSRGTSLNFYEPGAGIWNQVWVDNEGTVLRLGGGLRGGRMILEGRTQDGPTPAAHHRITWTPLDGGRVRQHWESSADAGATWSTLFDGLYARRPAP
jgi:hypothetical protein